MFDRIIWASNVIAPPRLSQFSISPKTWAIKIWRFWDMAWPSSPWIRSFRSVNLSCRSVCRWNVAESDIQIVEGKGFTPLIMYLVGTSCQCDDLNRQRRHLHFDWYETLPLLNSVVWWSKQGAEKITGVNRAGGIYQTRRTVSNDFVESIMIHENYWVETAEQTYDFLEWHWKSWCLWLIKQ